MKEKLKLWFIKNGNNIVFITIAILLCAKVFMASKIDELSKQNKVTAPVVKVVPKVIEITDEKLKAIDEAKEPKAEQCSINEAGKLVLSDASILKQSNYIFYDLDTFKYGSNRYDYTTSKKTKKRIFGVRYAREDRDGTQIYLMIYENIDDLKVNKKEYDKFMKLQTKEKL